MITTCTFEGCGRPYFCRGFCEGHYRHLKRYGEPRPLFQHRKPSEAVKFAFIAMGKRVDRHQGYRLERAAIRFANAEDDREWEAARLALYNAAMVLTWKRKSRRASSEGASQHTPAQTPSPVLGEGDATIKGAA